MVWKTAALGSVITITGGGTPSKKRDDFYQGTIPWATVRDMNNEMLSSTQFCINDEAVKASSTKIIPGGTLVIATRVGLGKVCILQQDTAINQDLKALQPIEEKVLRDYLFYWFKSSSELIIENGTGATVQGVKLSFIKNLKIPLPPLETQRRIVEILDSAFADIERARANAERNLENARELFDSYLQQFFSQRGKGWVKSKLGELFDIGSSKRIYAADWTSSGVPFFGGKEIVKLAKFGSVISNAYISEEKYAEYASKYDMPEEGDILMTARGTIGVGYIVQEGDKFYYKDGNILSLRQKTLTNPKFVLYAFRSKQLVDQIVGLTGTTVNHLPLNKAKELVLNVPSYHGQHEAVLRMEEMETNALQLARIYEGKLTSLKQLKQSLLQKAFSGELTKEESVAA